MELGTFVLQHLQAREIRNAFEVKADADYKLAAIQNDRRIDIYRLPPSRSILWTMERIAIWTLILFVCILGILGFRRIWKRKRDLLLN